MDTRGLQHHPLVLLLPLLLPSSTYSSPIPMAGPILPGQSNDLARNPEPQDGKLFLNDVKSNLAAYIANADLLNTDTYNYYLTLPEKLVYSSFNISYDDNGSAYTRGTLGNLALIGAAGYILSFLPQNVFTAITELVPPPINFQQPPKLELFQNPYTDDNNPVAGIKDVLPLQRDGEEGLEDREPREGVIKDWNRMDVKAEDLELVDTWDLQDLATSGSSPPRDWHRWLEEARMDTDLDSSGTQTEEDLEGRQEAGFLTSLGESLSSLLTWGTGPVARASEDIGFTALISSIANFWEDNFAWGTGKYSPKVMIERQSRHREGREGELLLQEEELLEEGSETQVSVAEAEVEDVNQKFVDEANEEEEEEPLMSDRMRPPPPFDYTML